MAAGVALAEVEQRGRQCAPPSRILGAERWAKRTVGAQGRGWGRADGHRGRPAGGRRVPGKCGPRAERAGEAWRGGLGAGNVWVPRPMAGGRPSAARPPRPPPSPSSARCFPPPPPRRQLRGASLKSAREL